MWWTGGRQKWLSPAQTGGNAVPWSPGISGLTLMPWTETQATSPTCTTILFLIQIILFLNTPCFHSIPMYVPLSLPFPFPFLLLVSSFSQHFVTSVIYHWWRQLYGSSNVLSKSLLFLWLVMVSNTAIWTALATQASTCMYEFVALPASLSSTRQAPKRPAFH